LKRPMSGYGEFGSFEGDLFINIKNWFIRVIVINVFVFVLV